jgi:hypothetical protein
MPFVLLDNPDELAIVRHSYSDGVALYVRELTDTEREKWVLEFSKLLGLKTFADDLEDLIASVAQVLIVDWEGVIGKDGDPMPCSPAELEKFIKATRTRKYWYKPILDYLLPERTSTPMPRGFKPPAAQTIDPEALKAPGFFVNR